MSTPWLLALAVVPLLACRPMQVRDSDVGGRPRTVEPSSSATAETSSPSPPEPARDPAVDEVRAWVLAARPRATVELIEPDESRGTSRGRELRVVARDGELLLDAWVPSDRRPPAEDYWQLAELVSTARSAEIDDLLRTTGWTLWTIARRTLLCREPSGACYALPAPVRVASFYCQPRGFPCTLLSESEEGRIEQWRIEGASGGLHRRRVRSWPAIHEPLEGRWDEGARIERGRRERMSRVTRPPIVDHPAFEARGGLDMADDPNGLGKDPCVPTVRSLRDGELVVRTVGCGEIPPMSLNEWPVAFVVTRAGRTASTPLFLPSPGPPRPERGFDVSVLAGADAIGFIAMSSDGGSPGGYSSEDLWVFVPNQASCGPRLHRLGVGSWSTEGLGNEDEREGYVVGVDRRRARIEVTGEGAARFVRCEVWSGTHARRSDRWDGDRRESQLDVRVTFDPDSGFRIGEGLRGMPCEPLEYPSMFSEPSTAEAEVPVQATELRLTFEDERFALAQPIGFVLTLHNVSAEHITLDGLLPLRASANPPMLEITAADGRYFCTSCGTVPSLQSEEPIEIPAGGSIVLMRGDLTTCSGQWRDPDAQELRHLPASEAFFAEGDYEARATFLATSPDPGRFQRFGASEAVAFRVRSTLPETESRR